MKSILAFYGVVFSLFVSFFSIQVDAASVYTIPDAYIADMRKAKLAYDQKVDADTLFELAMSYAYSGLIEKGWGMLKRIPEYNSDYAPVVLAKYGPLVVKEPNEWRHHFKLAFGYYFKGDKKEAIRQFEAVLKIDPKHVWAMGFIALIYGEQERYDDAIKLCRKALELEPNAAAIHFLLGEAYRKTGNTMGFLSEIMTVGRLKAAEKFVYPDY
jgi:tetratricopeptide (TPR) repeat protein